MMEVERGILGNELATYDVDAEAIIVGGQTLRRTLRQKKQRSAYLDAHVLT